MFKVKTVLTAKYTPTGLAKKYGTTYQAVVGELNKGIKVEGEHTGNKLVAKSTAAVERLAGAMRIHISITQNISITINI